jgi:DNA polymerase-3 subunit delta'
VPGRCRPPCAQVRQLEEDQKRRATRAQRDVLDRAMTDLLSLYRDVLVVQLGAEVDLVNGALADDVRALAADSTPEQTIRRMDAIGEARTRLAGNVAPLLAVEAMVVALRPQG